MEISIPIRDTGLGRCPNCKELATIVEDEGLYPRFTVRCKACGLSTRPEDYPSGARHAWNSMRGIIWPKRETSYHAENWY